jgi:hypothetical protein
MTTKTGRKKKYHYVFHFKRGAYFSVSRDLDMRYPKLFCGSGCSLHDSSFDVSFICTPDQYRNVVRYARRALPKFIVERVER